MIASESVQQGVYRKSDAPTVPHWAIIEFGERNDSYGERQQCVTYYTAFRDEAAWKKEIETRESGPSTSSNYVAVFVRPAIVKREIVVSVEETR